MRTSWKSENRNNRPSNLENIAVSTNSSENSQLPKGIRKIPYLTLGIWYKGMLGPKSQREFSEKINWKEKNLTTANALIFGLGLSALSYYGGEAVVSLEKMDFIKNIEGNLTSAIASILGTTSKGILYSYSGFNVIQSFLRIGYSQATGKAVPSFCLTGAFANVFNAADNYLRRKVK